MNQAKFPEWATPGLNRIMYGKAKANEADELTLSDFDATTGFLEGISGEHIFDINKTNSLVHSF
jgi:hypothetical protein